MRSVAMIGLTIALIGCMSCGTSKEKESPPALSADDMPHLVDHTRADTLFDDKGNSCATKIDADSSLRLQTIIAGSYIPDSVCIWRKVGVFP